MWKRDKRHRRGREGGSEKARKGDKDTDRDKTERDRNRDKKASTEQRRERHTGLRQKVRKSVVDGVQVAWYVSLMRSSRQ